MDGTTPAALLAAANHPVDQQLLKEPATPDTPTQAVMYTPPHSDTTGLPATTVPPKNGTVRTAPFLNQQKNRSTVKQ